MKVCGFAGHLRLVWTGIALATLSLLFSISASGQERGNLSRDALRQKFRSMESRARKALNSKGVSRTKFTVNSRGDTAEVVDGSRFDPVGIGLEYAFELVEDGKKEGSGKFVNPTEYDFSSGERFFVVVKSATRVQLALIQDYEDGRDSRVVLPNSKYPDSYSTVVPSTDDSWVRLPVLLQTDRDDKKEIMKIVAFLPDTVGKGKSLSLADIVSGESVEGTTEKVTDQNKSGAATKASTPDRGMTDAVVKKIDDLFQNDDSFRKLARFDQGVAARKGDSNEPADDASSVAVVAINEKSKVGVQTITILKKGTSKDSPIKKPDTPESSTAKKNEGGDKKN